MKCSIPFCQYEVFATGLCSRHYTAKRKYGDPTVVKQVQHHGISPEERFFRFVGLRSGCWKWIGSTDPNGYGRMNVSGKPILAHRISYTIHRGQIPKGMVVCHSCDNPNCVNPDHLFLGTQADNVTDMHNKGRAIKRALSGENHGNAKLTEEAVKEIRNSKESTSSLARKFGVSRAVVYAARERKTWTHIP
ncbi:HNH endonuclease [Rhizobium leguminosarum]|uniref:HNH endonuclease n=1 Tax=Rhizobium leguminosarum TaxID=384 RepID=UPI00293DD33E|nr:HNH endonuclease [Rhizobium leguminosarum]MDV4166197.1 HNH endonuclease [Rhizobium leguminosarum]